MALGKDWINWDTWNKTKAIYLLSLVNLVLNGISVWLLWTIAQHLGALASLVHGAATGASAAAAHAQQIAVISGGGTK